MAATTLLHRLLVVCAVAAFNSDRTGSIACQHCARLSPAEAQKTYERSDAVIGVRRAPNTAWKGGLSTAVHTGATLGAWYVLAERRGCLCVEITSPTPSARV